jgi:hypothetical protein
MNNQNFQIGLADKFRALAGDLRLEELLKETSFKTPNAANLIFRI